MATGNTFGKMLNQLPIKAPGMKAPGVMVQKPPGVGQFAFLGQGNNTYRHPMENRGKDVAQSVWARMLNTKMKGV